MVTGGGLSKDNKWISARDKYFLPVKVLSKLFRGKFLFYLRKAYKDKKLKFNIHDKELCQPDKFAMFIKPLYHQDWVVFCKPPPVNCKPETVLTYFARYTHKVAISNYRILKLENDKVYFKWKDYKDNSKIKIMALDAIEFMRRFLLHILPPKFVKIRYYGLLSNSTRKLKLSICRKLLNSGDTEDTDSESQNTDDVSWSDLLFNLTGVDINICPVCKKGKMQLKEILLPLHNHSPPKRNDA